MKNTIYVSPVDGRNLRYCCERKSFQSEDGTIFPECDGIPDFTYPQNFCGEGAAVRDFYDGRVEAYDKYLHLTFHTHGVDELEERESFIDRLNLSRGSKVLEIACGTGRDSQLILQKLSAGGQLFLQDISPEMIKRCRSKIQKTEADVEFSIGNAAYLPFPNGYFDAVYSFGGLGEFPDIRRSLQEMVRVCRVGGRVVAGDESMPPWLRSTEFSKILTHTNPQFAAEVPLADIPVEARDVNLRWVIGGVFYLIDFTVAEKGPEGNFDFEIPGVRGGTYRTRYYGQLEGVSPEAYELAHQARQKTGKSMYKWLSDVVTEAASKVLED